MAITEKEKKLIIGKGKTKVILSVPDDPSAVDVENLEDITAFDDPKFTKQFTSKAWHATTTTCRIFEALKAAGIPVAYRKKISPTRFRADKCEMILLEVVGRRNAVGSFTSRHPELKQGPPLRFSNLVVEFFLKTTKGEIIDRWKMAEKLELGGVEDPLILDPHAELWQLVHPKKPLWEEGAKLDVIKPVGIIDDARRSDGKIKAIVDMDLILRKVFLVLEKIWAMMGKHIIDIKLEFGINENDELVLADVVDNDSWRLRTWFGWEELSKQAFRDGEALEKVEEKYGIVAKMIEDFRIPDQVLVVWRGSENDAWILAPETYKKVPNLTVEMVTLSGHKQTQKCLDMLNELQRDYPSGVILATIGMSNGLGPILAAHTTWPVISVPTTIKECPEDVWSNLRTPSSTPTVVCLERNAINAALNILAQQNPTLYMRQQLAIEELDS